MMQMLFLSQKEKVESEHSLSNPNKFSSILLFLVLLLLPTQFGLHTWPFFSFVIGQRVDYLSPTFYVTDILLAALFLLSFPSLFKKMHPLFFLVVLFLGMGIFFSQNPFAGWWQLLKFCELSFFTGYVVFHVHQVKRYLFLAFALGLVFEGILALSQFGMQHALGGVFYFFGERLFNASTPGIANASINGALVLRPYGTFPHPNVLAGYILLVTLFFFIQAVFVKRVRVIALLLFTFGSVVLFVTLSRLAVVGWFASLLFLLTLSLKKKKQTFGIAVFLGGGVFSLFAIGLLRFRFSPFLLGDESVTLRLQLSQAALSMLYAHPFFGVGLHNFLNQIPLFVHQASFSELQPVHNIFLLIASETGFIGLFVFLFLLFFSFQKLWVNKKDSFMLWALVGLLSVCFIGLGDHYFLTLQQGQLFFALLLGLAWAKVSAHS